MNDSPRVLVADDNVALARVTQFALQRAGYNVVAVHDGQSAYDELMHSTFQLLITDQEMPGLSGEELSRKLRKHEEYFDLPIIILTAKGLEMDLEAVRKQLGIAATFPKPFSPYEIVSTVRSLLGQPAAT